MIDGYNEVPKNARLSILRDLQRFLIRVPEAHLVVSTRKFALPKELQFEVFSVLPFTNEMIQEYLGKVLTPHDAAERLYSSLEEGDGRMLQLARNPLLLNMIAKVASNGEIPNNRAKLLKLFTMWIFQRESKTLDHSVALYERSLSEFGFAMRNSTAAKLTPERAFQILQNVLRGSHETTSVHQLLEDLTATNLLTFNAKRGVQFTHEVFLEYYAACGLHTRVHLEGEAILNFAQSSDWHEPLRLYTGQLDNANDAVSELLEVDLILAARCIASGDNTSYDVQRDLIIRAKNAIAGRKGNSKAAVDAVTALLEVGTIHALAVVVRLEFDRTLPFDLAIWQCERPEQASTGLLKFGFSGRDRLCTCLRAFRGHSVSKRFLDSKEVAEAQCTLLTPPLVAKYLAAIEEIGLSEPARPAAERAISEYFENQPIDAKLLASCMRIVGNEGLAATVLDKLRHLISPGVPIDGKLAYNALTACRLCKKDASSVEVASDYAAQCFAEGLILLGCDFVSEFDLHSRFTDGTVRQLAMECAASGKLGKVFRLRDTFQNIDLSGAVIDVIQRVISNDNLNVLLQYASQLPIFNDETERQVYEAVLKKTRSSSVSCRWIRKIACHLRLQRRFVDIWHVRSFKSDRGFGFAQNVVTGDETFFHVSNLRCEFGMMPSPLATRLIMGSVIESSTHPGKLRLQTGLLL